MKKNNQNIVGNTESIAELVKVYYKDENDVTLLHKKMVLTTSLQEVIKYNPLGPDNISIEIFFMNVKHLRDIDLISLEKDKIRLLIDMHVDELVPKGKLKKTWQKMAVKLEEEIWKHDEEILSLLEADELAVTWGGPDVKVVKAKAGILYYVDNHFSFVHFDRMYKSIEDIPSIDLCELKKKAVAFSNILDKIIMACKKSKY